MPPIAPAGSKVTKTFESLSAASIEFGAPVIFKRPSSVHQREENEPTSGRAYRHHRPWAPFGDDQGKQVVLFQFDGSCPDHLAPLFCICRNELTKVGS